MLDPKPEDLNEESVSLFSTRDIPNCMQVTDWLSEAPSLSETLLVPKTF